MIRLESLIIPGGDEIRVRPRHHPRSDIYFPLNGNGIDLMFPRRDLAAFEYEEECLEDSLRRHPELFGIGSHFLDEALSNCSLPKGCAIPDFMGLSVDNGRWAVAVLGEAKSVKIHRFTRKIMGLSKLAAVLREDERILPFLLNSVSFPHFVFPDEISVPEEESITLEFSSPCKNPSPHRSVSPEVVLPRFSLGYQQVVFARAGT